MNGTTEIGVALQMIGVSKRFPGTLAVDAVDFEARVGEVHALMGENGAGKSTLMKMLAGSFNDYTGQVLISGTPVELHSPAAAKSCGIGMIYQELSLARPISIAENLLVGRLPRKAGLWLDRKGLYAEAERCLRRVGLAHLDPGLPVESISQHEAQLVEIAKVLGNNPCILVMDEPTSALSREEVQRLFEIIRSLRNAGLTIIYISHHLPEIFEIADRVTVLRDGRKIGTHEVRDVTPQKLVQMMVGQNIDQFYARRTPRIGDEILSVQRLTRRGFFHDISFHVKAGEILGIAGLSGAGRTELARSMCGLDPVDGGGVKLQGRWLPAGSYTDALRRGLCYLSEDRKNDGLFLRLPVGQNLVSGLLGQKRTRELRRRGEGGWRSLIASLIERLAISPPSALPDVGTLSGGNQQKVLLGKCLASQPAVLILDEPTRGVDVKAKMTIHEAVMEVAASGRAVVLISSDLPEMVGLADRVMVMRNGHMIGEMPQHELSEENILLAANGQVREGSGRLKAEG